MTEREHCKQSVQAWADDWVPDDVMSANAQEALVRRMERERAAVRQEVQERETRNAWASAQAEREERVKTADAHITYRAAVNELLDAAEHTVHRIGRVFPEGPAALAEEELYDAAAKVRALG